jgi:gentisate 1,2-dioxygenase
MGKMKQADAMGSQAKPAEAAGLERWTRAARYFEYSKAANPVGHQTPAVPFADFPAHLHEQGPTRIVPFDLSAKLRCPGPATSPSLCANFIRILAGERIETQPNATSEVYYVIRGRGRSRVPGGELPWNEGDFFTLPADSRTEHYADADAAFYWVHDEPLLRYLGVKAVSPRFEPTLYPRERAEAVLAEIERDPKAAVRSRVSVLLANEKFDQTLTITHVIWTMFGVLPTGSVQLPHRHESVALDYIIDCKPGCYTLIGTDLDKDGNIVNPKRADWHSGAAFVTPPGLWHAHYNESGAPAHLIPIQDAGLHTYLRTLDIKFFHPNHEALVSVKS